MRNLKRRHETVPRSWYFSRTITTISLWIWLRIDISCSAFVRRWLSGHNRRIQEKSSFQLNPLLNSLLSLKTKKKICFSFLYDLVIHDILYGGISIGCVIRQAEKSVSCLRNSVMMANPVDTDPTAKTLSNLQIISYCSLFPGTLKNHTSTDIR